MHDSRIFYLPAAILSACALLVGSVARLILGVGSDWTVQRIVDWVVTIVFAGFLYFVKQWMSERARRERELADTIRQQTAELKDALRAHISDQESFERHMLVFATQVRTHLGLHSEDSDPALRIGRRKGDRLVEVKAEVKEKKESANPEEES